MIAKVNGTMYCIKTELDFLQVSFIFQNARINQALITCGRPDGCFKRYNLVIQLNKP